MNMDVNEIIKGLKEPNVSLDALVSLKRACERELERRVDNAKAASVAAQSNAVSVAAKVRAALEPETKPAP